MRSKHALKEIAYQAGLSLATVDRVLHGRPGVRAATRARVEAAIEELDRHYAAAPLAGRRLSVDVVIEAPRRFTDAVRAAFEAEMPGMRPATFAARFHMAERWAPDDVAALLRAIQRRGSHGVVLKVPSDPALVARAVALRDSGVPVLTLVTDLPVVARQAYVGMDNPAAGRAVSWLMGHMLAHDPCRILVSMSRANFLGEEARLRGFRDGLAAHFPQLPIQIVTEGQGVDAETFGRVDAALEAHDDIAAIYSIGGGNRAILRAFAERGRVPRIFAAHDLDMTNVALLRDKKLTFVLHHDLRQDARTACQLFLHHHHMLPTAFRSAPSRFAIATPIDMI